MAKNFDEFRAGLQEIHFKLIADSVNELGLTIQLPITQENINNFVTMIIAVNTRVMLELLESYHDWNSQQ